MSHSYIKDINECRLPLYKNLNPWLNLNIIFAYWIKCNGSFILRFGHFLMNSSRDRGGGRHNVSPPAPALLVMKIRRLSKVKTTIYNYTNKDISITHNQNLYVQYTYNYTNKDMTITHNQTYLHIQLHKQRHDNYTHIDNRFTHALTLLLHTHLHYIYSLHTHKTIDLQIHTYTLQLHTHRHYNYTT